MAQKVVGYVRFQVPAGKATPAPPVGPALGQYGVNIGQFTKDFNERTKGDMGLMIPVVITVYADHSFTFVTKTPPAALLIKKACGIETASGVPQRDKVATISKEDVRKIAEQKMPDLNCTDIDSAMSMIAGTCRSMGVIVGDCSSSFAMPARPSSMRRSSCMSSSVSTVVMPTSRSAALSFSRTAPAKRSACWYSASRSA